MADGYISKNQAVLRLKKSDKNLVEQVKNYFSEDIKLQEDSNSFSFAISSAKVCDNLEKLGVLRHKTFKELHIPIMNYSLIRHFIRGFFDGDGSIFLCKHNSTIYLERKFCIFNNNLELFKYKKVRSQVNTELT